jgi:alpha-ketoglutarate-dependent taurine dioxygenase
VIDTIPGYLVEPLAPFGVVVRPVLGTPAVPACTLELRRRLLRDRLIVFRGFSPFANKEALAGYARSWGPLLEWSFGAVFEVAEQSDATNYLFTSGSVPYHWDGAFAKQVPWLQVFQCDEAPGLARGGETVFSDTARVWDSADEATRARWRGVEFEYVTEKLAHYGGRIRAPLVGTHPLTGVTVLRYNEPANADTADLNTPEVVPLGLSSEQSGELLDELRRVLYDAGNCYAHAWQPGDCLVADNFVLLHGRLLYQSQAPRRLWRVHVL